MPKIFKRHVKPELDDYVLKPTSELVVPGSRPLPETEQRKERRTELPPSATPEERELHFAQIQAEAILDDARREAETFQQEARSALEAELEQLRELAHQEGYAAGYAEGMAAAEQEGKRRHDELARKQIQDAAQFMELAARERDQLLDNTREEMKDLAVAIAEKVIRVSLKNSSDILLRMVDAATDTHKRCEWARIYVADCDLNGKAFTVPELTEALGHLSSRIRVVPMADDESGTCIVELPDVILDASVSTQMDNIKEVLSGVTLDRDEK